MASAFTRQPIGGTPLSLPGSGHISRRKILTNLSQARVMHACWPARTLSTYLTYDDAGVSENSLVRRALIEIGGFRTILSIALRREGSLLGIIHIYRQEVR